MTEILATSAALGAYAFSLDNRLRADRTTLVRMLASRLGPHEIVALDWNADSEPVLPVLPEHGPVRTT